MVENTAIWRATDVNNGGLEATANSSNIIKLNPSTLATDNGFVFNTEINYRIAVPEIPKVGGQINEVQDMGLDGIDIQIVGMFDKADTNPDISNLVTWMQQAKTISGASFNFEKARFGLRMDDFPQFNVTPKADPNGYGYMLAGVRFTRMGENKKKVGYIITLRFSGDITGLGT